MKEQRDESLFTILIITMIIGIIIVSIGAFYFRTHLYNRKDFFSEVYFPNPSSLPNKVKIGETYEYNFTIRSQENTTKELRYVNGLELYRIYPVTEAKYNCLREYRKRVYLDWTNETPLLLGRARTYEQIEPMAVLPSYEKKIGWENYSMEFGFSPSMGRGQLLVYFRNETDVKYSILFDEASNTTVFNNEKIIKGPDLKKDNNKIKINVANDIVNVYYGKKLIISQKVNSATDGSFGLYTQDAFFVIQGFTVYKDNLVVIPMKDTVIEFPISDNILFNKLWKVGELRKKSVSLVTSYPEWNESIDCTTESFYCVFFDMPNDVTFYLEEANLTKVVEKIPVTENINYFLYPYDKSVSYLNWEAFNISFSHNQIVSGSKAALILKFSEKWAVMITRNNSYWIRPGENSVLIDEIRNPLKVNMTYEDVKLNVNRDEIKLIIANRTVFTRKTPIDYTNGSIETYIKNEYIYLNPVTVKNDDPACLDIYSLKYCELVLLTSRSRMAETASQFGEAFNIDYASHESSDQKFNLFEYTSGYFPGLSNESQAPAPVKNVLDIPIYNKFIPDRRILFNRPLTIILNSSNFSLDYDYQSLDGARVIEIGLMDFLGNERLTMSILEREGKLIIYYYDGNKTTKTKTVIEEINLSKSHHVSLEIRNGNAFFYYDYKKKLQLNDTGINSGEFFIGSRNTYVDMGEIHLNIKDKNLYMNLPIKEDPCQLKLVYRQADEKSITLSPEETFNATVPLLINQEFDYGKAFVELYGSGNMTKDAPLEVHFWVIKDDI